MTQFADQNRIHIEQRTYLYDPNKLEATHLEDILVIMIKSIKREIDNTMECLQGYSDIDEDVTNIILMINAMELLQTHFEFVLAVLNTKSEDEVQKIKDKFPIIKQSYENVKAKEDLSPVPAKTVVAMMHDKIMLELRRILSKYFKKNSLGEVTLIKNEENRGRIKIMKGRFELACSHFPWVITFPKDDIFCYEKSSPTWQDLYKAVTFKEILTQKEIEDSSKRFTFYLYFSHLIIKNKIYARNLPYTQAITSFFQDVLYYGIQHAEAETQALVYLLNPDVQEVFKAWQLAEHPLFSKVYLMHTPTVEFDERIFIPRLFPSITADLIKKEYADKTLNNILPMNLTQLKNLGLYGNKDEILEDLFVERGTKVPIRILSHENLQLKESRIGMFSQLMHKAQKVLQRNKSNTVDQNFDKKAIVVHIHGGGFVATSSLTHRVYLKKWVRSLNLIHFSIDYRLSPENKYPDALDDVWQAYLWILNFANSVLGINNQKIILVGDSAGGNLALSLTHRLVRAGLEPPHGCLLMYPALYIDANSYSPSYFNCIDDPMLPCSLIKLVVKAYVPEGFDNTKDPFISPLLASDEILAKLPPIRIVAGSRDIFYDDNLRLLARLRNLNKNAKLVVLAHLSHGFLSQHELKDHDMVAEEACELIRELILLNH